MAYTSSEASKPQVSTLLSSLPPFRPPLYPCFTSLVALHSYYDEAELEVAVLMRTP